MTGKTERHNLAEASFRLGDWLVEPRLNRLTLGDESIQIEHKMMDVLVCLAEQPRDLVPRHHIIDTVWAIEFISEGTLTRIVAELRRVLGDDAREPRFIETIRGKGYRLLVPVEVERQDSGKIARFPARAADDDRNPYPGLAAFTEDDAEFFFGRETEVSALWRKITSRRLLAVIGPSGVGKTSFLRAGLLSATPEGWGTLICQPGEGPFAALARALAPGFGGDAEAISRLVDISNQTAAVAGVSRWRDRHDQALLIVDQFEELFTLNPPEVQAEFATLIGRLARDVDVHVVLSMRDDFLYRCHEHEALSPVFSGLIPVKVPAHDDLLRALVEPAARFGYAFEDEGLVDEMLDAVAGERGALPLLAFAVERLWIHRDREKKLLTRRAYSDIGGVAGALAHHAETTLERIGAARQPVVRELFRNLVTAEGTRAVREWNELLSVFDRGDVSRAGINPAPTTGIAAAEGVLRALIDARLLTSYEVDEEDGEPTRRVEIIHESLLANWPRLVRWQTQDADAAQVRDQLRQAARTWEEHGRTDDMLWTGSAYREFSVWLVHYPGGLTETEEAFAEAMTRHDERRSRRRRLAATAAFAVLLAVLAIVGGLWRRSVTEARRAEATKLLALGRLELDDGPTTALAYATASLELLDGPETRRFALEALWRGPTAFRLSVAESHGACTPSFSPDGRWLAQDHEPGRLWFYPRDGSAPTALETVFDSARQLIHFEFGHDSNLLVCSYWVLDEDRFDHRIGFWSVPDGREIRTLELEGPTEATLAGDRLVTATKMGDGKRWLRSWPLGGGEPSMLGHIDSPWWDVDPALTWLGWAKDRDVLLHSLGTSVTTSRPIVAHHPEPPRHVGLDPDGHRFATAGESGLVWLWSLADGEAKLLRTFEESEAVSELVFHPAGSKLAWGEVGTIKLWDIEGPPEADPLELRTTAVDLLAFHPDGRWLYSSDPLEEATLWNLGRRYPHILRGHKDWVQGLAFAPDGSWLASRSWLGEVRVWPLAPLHQKSRRIFSIDEVGAELRVGSEGNTLVTTSGEGMILLPVDGKPPTTLGGLPSGSIALSLALGPRDRLVAAGTQRVRGRGEIWVWDLHTGEARKLDPGWVVSETPLADDVSDDTVSALVFTPDGRLISAGGGGIISWDLEDGSGKVLLEQTGEFPTFALSAGGRHLVVTDGDYADPALTRSKLTRVDLEDGTTQPVTSHGTRVQARALAFDPTGRILVTGDLDGVVRVGPVTGAEPHLFLGHKGSVDSVAVSPGGQWIASGGEDGTIRLWPMPDLSEPPLHTWPRDELIAKLKTLTNLRVVHDEESSTGWKIDIGPFPGWATVPSW